MAFIINKNQLNQLNNFKVIGACVFFGFIIENLQNPTILLSNIFIFLSIRRVLSFRSSKEISNKIFDATLWILIASLLYPPSIIFLLILFFGLIINSILSPRHLSVVLSCFLLVVLISFSYNLYLTEDFSFARFIKTFNFYFLDQFIYFKPIETFKNYSLPFFIFFVFSLAVYIKSISLKRRESRKIHIVFVLYIISCFFVNSFSKATSIIFLLFPFCVLYSFVLEALPKSFLKNVYIFVTVLGPILLYLF